MDATSPLWAVAFGLAVGPTAIPRAALAEPIYSGGNDVLTEPAQFSDGAVVSANSELTAFAEYFMFQLRVVFQSLAFAFSEEFWTPGRGREIAEAVWYPTIVACLLYFPIVRILQQRLGGRKERGGQPQTALRCGTFIWNLLLSLLSLWGFVAAVLKQPGLLLTPICPEKDYHPTVRMVIAIFTLTKAVEFGDTFLLILKRRPIPFIHTYHHFTVTLYCLHAQYTNVGFAHLFAFMNLFVHAIMYMYYAAATAAPAAKFLRRLRPFITLLQLLQMLVGMYVSVRGLVNSQQLAALSHGEHSEHLEALSQLRNEEFNARLAVCMYTSYCFLFARLYCSSYMPAFDSDRLGLALTVHAAGVIGAYHFALLFQQDRHQCFKLLLLLLILMVVSLYGTRSSLKGQQQETREKPQLTFGSSRSSWTSLVLITNWIAGLSIKAAQSSSETRDSRASQETASSANLQFRSAGVSGQPPTAAEAEGIDRFGSRLSESSTTAGDGSEAGTPTAFGNAASENFPECSFAGSVSPSSFSRTNAAVSLRSGGADGEYHFRNRAQASNRERQEMQKSSPNESSLQKRECASLLRRFIQKGRWPTLSIHECFLCATGLLFPALYGYVCMQNALGGLCVVGALRWALEMEISKRVVRQHQ